MPSRRELIQLTDEEISNFLATEKTVIMVSNGKDGFPHPMPMWFYADDANCIHCTTFKKAQKVVNYKRDSKATLLVESGEEYAELKGLVIYADTEVIDDTDQVANTLMQISIKGQDVSEEDQQKILAGVQATAAKRVLLKFTPVKVLSWDHQKLGGKY